MVSPTNIPTLARNSSNMRSFFRSSKMASWRGLFALGIVLIPTMRRTASCRPELLGLALSCVPADVECPISATLATGIIRPALFW
jgi:hypothetical protein